MQQLQKSKTDYLTFPFIKDGLPLSSDSNPLCAMTVRSAGSMRFRWTEENPNRDKVLASISSDFGNKAFVPIQLDHTHIVYDIQNTLDTDQKIGDGIITLNKALIPTVTVADCLPIYLYDSVSKAFGIVHSGWKGTGIICKAIELAGQKYGSKVRDFSVVIGPHIHECCYIVNQERADFFASNFGPECLKELEEGVQVDWNNGGGKLFRLSLAQANLSALLKLGIKKENIFISKDCTCCSNDGFYGSNRRETKLAGRPDAFTVQAAFIAWK